MKIAVLADIHGNIPALEAVLSDIARRKPDLIVDLGDCASGPLWPRETMERLADLRVPTVRGNHDRQVSTLPPETMGASDRFAHGELEAHLLERLRDLPSTLWLAPDIFAFHGAPQQDDGYFLDEVVNGRPVRARLRSVADRLGETHARLILRAHSHRPDMLRLPTGALVVTPGSVGCPAYDDSTDPAHVSGAGSPHARYARLDIEPNRDANVEFRAVTYRHESAAQRAESNGRPEWAHALRTGPMPAMWDQPPTL